MRYTKIICTIGPASDGSERIAALAKGGMNIARINMSHGSPDAHRKTIQEIQVLNTGFAKDKLVELPCVAILADTQGPEIRTGDRKEPLVLSAGQEVLFAKEDISDEHLPVITVGYDYFDRDAPNADNILLDNGEMSFEFVSARSDGSVVAKARGAGTVGSRRHVNLPGIDLQMPSVTDKDWADIDAAIQEKADFLALSFVREAADIEKVREYVQRKQSPIQIIAKIETRQAVTNIREIIEAADGIMVARGDLGAEVPFETVPAIQDEIVYLCREASKPVIVATHMLESMTEQPMPTRAEVTDIAHAATTKTDATMLSGETASGKHVLGSLDAMDRVLRATEDHLARMEHMEDIGVRTNREARAEAAVSLAVSTNAAAIVVITRSGSTARDVCKYRPHLPIIAFTPDAQTQRHLQLSYGILPFTLSFEEDSERTITSALQKARQLDVVKPGDKVIVVADMKSTEDTVHTIQVRKID